jgi:hypothetical protein
MRADRAVSRWERENRKQESENRSQKTELLAAASDLVVAHFLLTSVPSPAPIDSKTDMFSLRLQDSDS